MDSKLIDIIFENIKEVQTDFKEFTSKHAIDMAEIRAQNSTHMKILEEHMKRTETAEERLDKLENFHYDCPAREALKSRKSLATAAKDWTILIGLLALIFNTFWPVLSKLIKG